MASVTARLEHVLLVCKTILFLICDNTIRRKTPFCIDRCGSKNCSAMIMTWTKPHRIIIFGNEPSML